MTLKNVVRVGAIDNRVCVMAKVYTKPVWCVKQIVRGDSFAYGLVEDLCEHGIGHPNSEWLVNKAKHWGIHGCDGCCSESTHGT